MKISCSGIGKRFNRDWIFRDFNFEFTQGNKYAITGPNGSGKSTLLQVLAGAMIASAGKIHYRLDNIEQEPDEVFNYISIAAPYLEVIEEMTLREFLGFHHTFKSFLPAVSIERIIGLVGLEKAASKQIRYYSSGMKQRVKLAQAIFSDTPCLLLDEPCTNLDSEGVGLYQRLISEFCAGRLVIVSSNDPQEYEFCTEVLSIKDYK
jgi:ABC-type multidrug transport system ATPase subunit